MRVLLTGGSGDLGKVLSRRLIQSGDHPVRLDVRPPGDSLGEFVAGSVLDRAVLAKYMTGIDVVVHIAAWHGIHEVTGQKDVFDFWDLNVTGTFYVFEEAVRAGIKKVVFISSTSIDEPYGVYGHTKVLGEQIAETYVQRHGLDVITLRPRAFIPYWNRAVYQSFVGWAAWFWGGAVHIDDVAQGTHQAVNLLGQQTLPEHLILTLDGAYEYSEEDLQNWDADGPGSTFKKYYPNYYDLVLQHGLDPAKKPVPVDIQETTRWLGYSPTYSLKNLLEELANYGIAGPPIPIF